MYDSSHDVDTHGRLDTKFIYCIANEDVDLTHEFENFKLSILHNKTLTTQDIVLMIGRYHGKHVSDEQNIKLKLAMDDTFDELTFKGMDTLMLHNGSKQ
jgi:hypothetical protein